MKYYLSHPLTNNTPTYGNRTSVSIQKLNSIKDGSTVNESYIELPLHAGTHLDYPFHFYDNGQTHSDFEASFWFFDNPVLLEINTKNLILEEELIDKLGYIEKKSVVDLLLVKTNATSYRDKEQYWKFNHGLSPKVADFIRYEFPKIRCVGMDFISLTSFQHSDIGKEAHLAFLNPNKPILLVEDMILTDLSEQSRINSVIIAPVRIENSDGVPVSCFADVNSFE